MWLKIQLLKYDMDENSISYIKKIQRYAVYSVILILVLYMVIVITLYRYYSNKAEIEKTQLLQRYYKQILKISTSELIDVAARLSISLQDQNLIIHHNSNNIEICSGEKCIKYYLYKFKALLDFNTPKFIHYRIKLNGKLLCSNTKFQNYEIDTVSQFNKDYFLNISLVADNAFLQQLESNIKKPFWIFSISFPIIILLLYILSNAFKSVFNKIYLMNYQDKYGAKLKQLETEYQNKLQSAETIWKKEIWNKELNQQKDIEINHIFSQKANQIALINNILDHEENMIQNHRLRKHSNAVPCSIILYQNQEIEAINVTELIELFTNRFKREDKNITIKVSSLVKIVNFTSSEALYQIIYSIIKYLYFLITQQFSANNYNIQLFINAVGKNAFLRFEYNGYPIKTEIDFLQLSSNFYKTHANPFLLNPEQICNLLKTNKFDYRIGYDNINFMEIHLSKNNENKSQTNGNNNVILFNSFSKTNDSI